LDWQKTRCCGAMPVWGSIERNTGAWCPYTQTEDIEAAFQRGDASIFLPECFNATILFGQGMYHHQTTPAVGSKPEGARSVIRGEVGQTVSLFYADHKWTTHLPDVAGAPSQDVTIFENTAALTDHRWQWCDLQIDSPYPAVESNWHPYAEEHSSIIEDAWKQGVSTELVIGLSTYRICSFQGTYAIQHNLTSGFKRQVRRGRFAVQAPAPDSSLADESCALCTELFSETPQWPVTRTPCGHTFHYTCLNQLVSRQGHACPLCRQPLPSSTTTRSSTQRSASAGGLSWHDSWVPPREADATDPPLPRPFARSQTQLPSAI